MLLLIICYTKYYFTNHIPLCGLVNKANLNLHLMGNIYNIILKRRHSSFKGVVSQSRDSVSIFKGQYTYLKIAVYQW